ncbi:unnamed protein product [Sphenostylis stenocarpa]|uniref:Uncharacterized protein n=1 Tax=Sphenostylis stenocarpa TaxID=92480 RepID=A0AA86VWF2_9FABA|nr:unnamed protein product [Sphenostylis stenocarpa]
MQLIYQPNHLLQDMDPTAKPRALIHVLLILILLDHACLIHSRNLANSPAPAPASIGPSTYEKSLNPHEGRKTNPQLGSFPATCQTKCNQCKPCVPVEVTIKTMAEEENQYYPIAWKYKDCTLSILDLNQEGFYSIKSKHFRIRDEFKELESGICTVGSSNMEPGRGKVADLQDLAAALCLRVLVMEGLIPYVMDAIRKQKPGHIKINTLSHSHSDSSERSYHLLLGSDSFHGSHHGHRVMEPATTSSYAATTLRNRKS